MVRRRGLIIVDDEFLCVLKGGVVRGGDGWCGEFC